MNLLQVSRMIVDYSKSYEQYPILFTYLLFEYCIMLYKYNENRDWKDKDMIYLCHYYLSIYVAMYFHVVNDTSNSMVKIQLAIARGMLGDSYFHIGKLIENDDFRLSMDLKKHVDIPYKLLTLQQ